MAWPSAVVTTTNLDAAGDSPAAARADLLDAVQKLNTIITDGTPCNMAVFRASTSQSSGTTLIFNSEANDETNNYDNATGIFTPPTDDYYAYSMQAYIQNTSGAPVDVTISMNASITVRPATLRTVAAGATVPIQLGGCVFATASTPISWTISPTLSATLLLTPTTGNGWSMARMVGR